MTTLMDMPVGPSDPTALDRAARRLGRALRAGRALAGAVVGAKAPAALSHLKEHAYSMLGLGSFAGAGFDHSTFTGLLTLGAAFLVFEFKAATEDEK